MNKLLAVFGAAMLLGIVGCEGPTTPDPSQGPPGPAGPVGPTGPAGKDGADGAQGLPGLPGVAGPTGAQGATGAVGPAGQAGAQGVAGVAGPQGLPGTPGAKGATGATGATGPTGPTGPAGVCTCTSQSKEFVNTVCATDLALPTGWTTNADGTFKDVVVQVFKKAGTEWQNFSTFALTNHDSIDLPPFATSTTALVACVELPCTYRVVVSSCTK